VRDLLCRKSNFVVTCALANKLARIAWALTARQQTYVGKLRLSGPQLPI
ncbi:hypothetical protein AB8S91_30790, partial [Klebsiella pneumoniae]